MTSITPMPISESPKKVVAPLFRMADKDASAAIETKEELIEIFLLCLKYAADIKKIKKYIIGRQPPTNKKLVEAAFAEARTIFDKTPNPDNPITPVPYAKANQKLSFPHLRYADHKGGKIPGSRANQKVDTSAEARTAFYQCAIFWGSEQTSCQDIRTYVMRHQKEETKTVVEEAWRWAAVKRGIETGKIPEYLSANLAFPTAPAAEPPLQQDPVDPEERYKSALLDVRAAMAEGKLTNPDRLNSAIEKLEAIYGQGEKLPFYQKARYVLAFAYAKKAESLSSREKAIGLYEKATAILFPLPFPETSMMDRQLLIGFYALHNKITGRIIKLTISSGGEDE